MVRETNIDADQHINIENRVRPSEPTKVEEFLEAVAASFDFNWGHVTDVSYDGSSLSGLDEYVIHMSMTQTTPLEYHGIINMAHEGYTVVKINRNKTDGSGIDRFRFVKFSDITGDDRNQPDPDAVHGRFERLGL